MIISHHMEFTAIAGKNIKYTREICSSIYTMHTTIVQWNAMEHMSMAPLYAQFISFLMKRKKQAYFAVM